MDDPDVGTLSYRGLRRGSDHVRDQLWQRGVRPGARVGICMRKSRSAIVAMLGTLKCGAVYVPLDPHAPVGRTAAILEDCEPQVVLSDAPRRAMLTAAIGAGQGQPPPILVIDDATGTILADERWPRRPMDSTAPASLAAGASDLAYILYTSGTTGRPKGVMMTQRNVATFLDWCSDLIRPSVSDVFSSHAPLHFDLSVLDVFVPLLHGARVVLLDDAVGKEPRRLAGIIAEKRISVWYSTPSILNLLARFGRLDRHDCTALRMVLFAGDVFPVDQLVRLKAAWPQPRYFNLYGPTETNVCTCYELPAQFPVGRTDPFPIGRPCAGFVAKVVDGSGAAILAGGTGELHVSGPGMMPGYWCRPEEDARVFSHDAAGTRWYHTGDVVMLDASGELTFRGRSDRMVKRRGYRIELGEIEVAFAAYPAVVEAAAIALHTPDGVRIKVCLGIPGDERPSLFELRRFCVEALPGYMLPDIFEVCAHLPRNARHKVDYRALMATESGDDDGFRHH